MVYVGDLVNFAIILNIGTPISFVDVGSRTLFAKERLFLFGFVLYVSSRKHAYIVLTPLNPTFI